MITPSILVVSIFVVITITLLLTMIFADFIKQKELKPYYIATTAIYLSGVLLILILVCLNSTMPFIFSIISETCILVIYIFTMFIIRTLGKNIQAIRSELVNQKEDGIHIDEEI